MDVKSKGSTNCPYLQIVFDDRNVFNIDVKVLHFTVIKFQKMAVACMASLSI
jgi:hypothetical protein